MKTLEILKTIAEKNTIIKKFREALVEIEKSDDAPLMSCIAKKALEELC